jgi:predicted RNA-binding protein associated with RNAse of E/G family
MWEEGHARLRCWYVNLQEPCHRTSIGFDTADHLLDIVVNPDQSEWWWKDEDEFAEAQATGVLSVERAREIRTEGKRVLARMQADESPWCDGWEDWRPPPEWPIPELPEGWDSVAEFTDTRIR